jgi:Cohesin domain
MSNKRLHLLVAFIGLLYLPTAKSEVRLDFPAINNAQTGSVVDLPLTVYNFDSIAAFQFVVRWNPQVLRLEEIYAFNWASSFTLNNFNQTFAIDSGFVSVLWPSSSGSFQPFSRPDGTVLFRMRLRVIGANTSFSPFLVTENPPPRTVFEVVKQPNNSISLNEADIDQGFVAVGYMVDTRMPAAESGFRFGAAPNPAQRKDGLKVWFESDRTRDVRMVLVNIQGQSIYETNLQCSEGRSGTEIAFAVQPPPGTYFLVVYAAGISRTEKLQLQ